MKGCDTLTEKINVMGAPKFFTPNGDGFNEFWNIKGIDRQLNTKTSIRIYDRYGKLLSQINPLSFGWDGTFNNKIVPADDYWYYIEFSNGRIVKGHFALIR